MRQASPPSERRFATGTKPQLRTNRSASSPGTIVGRAIVYNSRSEKIGGQFYEVVLPGALDGSLSDQSIRALFEHSGMHTLGKMGSGTLRLMPGADGIDVEIDLPNTGAGRDAAELVSRGDISGMSFGFTDGAWDWSESSDGSDIGFLKKARLLEITLTANPAYLSTTATLTSGVSGRSRPRSNAGAGASAQDRQAKLQAAEKWLASTKPTHRERRLRLAEAELELMGDSITRQLTPAFDDRCGKHNSVQLLSSSDRDRRNQALWRKRSVFTATGLYVGGLAARFEIPIAKRTRNVSLSRRAFDDSLARVRSGKHAVELRAGHDATRPLASTADGTLALWTTHEGLRFSAFIGPSVTPDHLYQKLDRNETIGASVCWSTERYEDRSKYFDCGYRFVRDVQEASLEDVCITLNPADKACTAYRATHFVKGTTNGK